MSDLVSRKWLLEEYDRRHKGPAGRARKLIEAAPAVDAVEVIALQKQLHREYALLCRTDADFDKAMGGYNPSSFVAGFNYALERMSGWTTSLNGERKEE